MTERTRIRRIRELLGELPPLDARMILLAVREGLRRDAKKHAARIRASRKRGR